MRDEERAQIGHNCSKNKYLRGKMNQLTNLLESTIQLTSHDSCISNPWT